MKQQRRLDYYANHLATLQKAISKPNWLAMQVIDALGIGARLEYRMSGWTAEIVAPYGSGCRRIDSLGRHGVRRQSPSDAVLALRDALKREVTRLKLELLRAGGKVE